ncbi:hypothetical protein [Rhizobium terrae]|uniref:hypothetical protein n=1 Tax=Rhizobium terrae TaxID=2171756 RepID=UPI000E3D34FF|nr:hypothetical protein [Rhizobium terrae]
MLAAVVVLYISTVVTLWIRDEPLYFMMPCGICICACLIAFDIYHRITSGERQWDEISSLLAVLVILAFLFACFVVLDSGAARFWPHGGDWEEIGCTKALKDLGYSFERLDEIACLARP